ncbi:MAG: hypothetical protein COY40_01195 [Alphaproteobacteria bacterium CG_4_10_14_0_8_um_filter_53_9]|nr:MAG: hypothetical protein COY40_01195 [Alphaproteobacteria bacterium CG_4_10_14_0_8_um_filter_53_9]
MPAYTILIMKRDELDKRPVTLHIAGWVFWGAILSAIAVPIIGFALSAGWAAPTWMKLNFARMEEQVAGAKQTEQTNADLTAGKQKLEEQLQAAMSARAEAEARLTMAETARVEASSRLGELEGEVLNMKKELAAFQNLLKPKLDKELVECADLSVRTNDKGIVYSATLSKISRSAKLPDDLKARVSIMAGNNIVALDQSGKSIKPKIFTLDFTKSPKLEGEINHVLPEGTTRLMDIKILNDTQVVGYCWKSF